MTFCLHGHLERRNPPIKAALNCIWENDDGFLQMLLRFLCYLTDPSGIALISELWRERERLEWQDEFWVRHGRWTKMIEESKGRDNMIFCLQQGCRSAINYSYREPSSTSKTVPQLRLCTHKHSLCTKSEAGCRFPVSPPRWGCTGLSANLRNHPPVSI